jgi:transcriptional regulator with XRE-family HTH domain
MTGLVSDVRVGPLLRSWRERRRLSQLDLALEAGVSARHVSFVETGRSRPSAEMVLHLAEQLEVPLRERNALLLAAGYAPAYDERPLDAPEMTAVREAIDRVLAAHDPYPAAVVNRGWNLVAANRGMGLLVAGVAPELLAPPANVMRLSFHPEGAAPRILNLGEWRTHLLERLTRQVAATGDAGLEALLEEVRAYPAPDDAEDMPADNGIAIPLRIRTEEGDLELLSTIATFGTAVDITVAELSIESFFPADERTGEILRGYVARSA